MSSRLAGGGVVDVRLEARDAPQPSTATSGCPLPGSAGAGPCGVCPTVAEDAAQVCTGATDAAHVSTAAASSSPPAEKRVAADLVAAELIAAEETERRATLQQAARAAAESRAARMARASKTTKAAAWAASRAAVTQLKKPPAAPPAPLPPPPTGPGIAARVQATYGWPCDLIGSSHFYDGADIDLVLTVSGGSLAEAYARVIAATGWEAIGADAISGHRVVSLHGTFDGVRVDAQVWRGSESADTEAERKTAAALEHTATLLGGACARCRQSIILMHRWADASGLKAARLGMPPGIAWTVAATMLWQSTVDWDSRTDDARLEALLGALVLLLRTEGVPCIALGRAVHFASGTGCCD